MSAGLTRALRALWRFLRDWSGDSAYDTYVAHAPGPHLSRRSFYLDTQQRRYRGPSRCC